MPGGQILWEVNKPGVRKYSLVFPCPVFLIINKIKTTETVPKFLVKILRIMDFKYQLIHKWNAL